ncbi:MAG: ATP-grasp domain-containing protein [Acidobacteria bacterium]|nr:ATP-grasp domain-containing protein [Acidobacteriota bacterium]MBK8148492.1 ATP-grasp domain-containing protein [Acidobacteriota bacterium]
MKKYIVCIASEFKGNEFLEECHNAGWHVTLVTRNDLKDAAWAWTSLNEVQTVDGYASVGAYVRTITNIAGSQPIDRIVGLDEFDVLTAAKVREHLQIEGISGSYGLRFRDKLRMRNLASELGIPCPEFVGAFNQDAINEYLDRVPGPWIVKPRTEVSAFGIRKCETKDQVWDVLTDLDNRNTWRDHPSQFLIERFITGKVYHVDSVVENGEIVAAGVSEYGTPPFTVTHMGGVFSTYTVDYRSKLRKELEKLNKKLLEGFEYKRGVAHAEFLRCAETGEFFLLEVACRVGGAYIANVTEYANGFNLWREWAKVETATEENPYKAPKVKKEYAGICLALAKEDHPDTSHFDDPEVVYRVHKPHHVGLILHSKKKDRLYELLGTYADRIAAEFLAVAPAKERYDD